MIISLLSNYNILNIYKTTPKNPKQTKNKKGNQKEDTTTDPDYGEEIMEISGDRYHKVKGKKYDYQLRYVMENKGVVTAEDWGQIDAVFEDCMIQDGMEDDNLVVLYLNKLDVSEKHVPKMMEIVAELAKRKPQDLFDRYIIESEEDPVVASGGEQQCPSDHNDLTIYKAIDHAGYFVTGSNWGGLSCNQCNRFLVNKIVGTDPSLVKPSISKPAHLCPSFQSYASDCRHVLCDDCYCKLLIASDKKHQAKVPPAPIGNSRKGKPKGTSGGPRKGKGNLKPAPKTNKATQSVTDTATEPKTTPTNTDSVPTKPTTTKPPPEQPKVTTIAGDSNPTTMESTPQSSLQHVDQQGSFGSSPVFSLISTPQSLFGSSEKPAMAVAKPPNQYDPLSQFEGSECCYSKCENRNTPIQKRYTCEQCKKPVHNQILGCSIAADGDEQKVICKECA